MRLLIAIGVVAGGLGACSWTTEPPARFSEPEPAAQAAPRGMVMPVFADDAADATAGGSPGSSTRRPLEEIADRLARALLGKQVSGRVRRGIVRQAARFARRFLGQLGTGTETLKRLRKLGRRLWGTAGGLGALSPGVRRDPLGRQRGRHDRERDASWRRLRRSRCWKGDANACRREALAFDGNDGGGRSSMRARIYYRKACRLGHGPSCAHLGAIYESGRGLARPLPRLARRYYDKACAAGDLDGCRRGTRVRPGGPATRPPLRWLRQRPPGIHPPGTGVVRTIRI